MCWGEAVRLAGVLCGDMSSQLAAHLNGWQRPFEWCEWAVLDMLDLYRSANIEMVGLGAIVVSVQYRFLRAW